MNTTLGMILGDELEKCSLFFFHSSLPCICFSSTRKIDKRESFIFRKCLHFSMNDENKFRNEIHWCLSLYKCLYKFVCYRKWKWLKKFSGRACVLTMCSTCLKQRSKIRTPVIMCVCVYFVLLLFYTLKLNVQVHARKWITILLS